MGLSENLTQASNAVDGLKSNLSVWGGQCVISDINQQTATWWVNLTSILSIQDITIYYRTGNINWGRYIKNVQLFYLKKNKYLTQNLSSFLECVSVLHYFVFTYFLYFQNDQIHPKALNLGF